MKQKAVLITMHDGTFMIEMFPEDAPNTVKNFLELVESGYYDGIVFHRIIPGFMIQGGDPNTKNPEYPQQQWGQGGPGYTIDAEFNTLQHDRGMVSMARSQHPNSAGSQFFIVHNDSNFLDGQYTVFGRLVTGTHSLDALDRIANFGTNELDQPLDVSRATIKTAKIIEPFATAGFGEPDRNTSILSQYEKDLGQIDNYQQTFHKVSFDIPFRWDVIDEGGDYLDIVLEPGPFEHNVQQQIEESGFTPQVLIISEKRDPTKESGGVSTANFSIRAGDTPKVLSNYVFQNEDGRKAHMLITTQDYVTEEETVQFKMLQIHFMNSEFNYSIVYVNISEWFRYEVNAFVATVDKFEIDFDGQMQPIDFSDNPVFKQLISDAKAKPETESLPPARVGGCLIATASYGSELAPQIQHLRELRDNTVLQLSLIHI